MAESVSIVMKMNEDITSKLKSIASTTQGCSKEFEELSRKGQNLSDRYHDLNKRAAEASSEALSVKRAMDEASKAFKKSGDEADRLRFESLKAKYDELTTSAKGYSEAAKDTVKDMRALNDEIKKMETPEDQEKEMGGLMSSLFGGDLSGKLAQSGLYQMVGDAASNVIGTLAESALGQPLASLGSSIASGGGRGAPWPMGVPSRRGNRCVDGFCQWWNADLCRKRRCIQKLLWKSL